MVTTNERSLMVASIMAVATICAQRAGDHPRPEHRRRIAAAAAPVDEHHAGQEHQRERKAEQEAHMGGADGAERRGQLALHGVARGLAAAAISVKTAQSITLRSGGGQFGGGGELG